ncbi:unnamed protein product [Dibothriocephalus latus]|uniref:Uncharacterized protein n=1 Tax=Dibothriocephalus latus TaxID=60516 RepID=A0A3P6QSM9_DIBLA|nr:unnamed protein product [Dibothriocephalus latus]
MCVTWMANAIQFVLERVFWWLSVEEEEKKDEMVQEHGEENDEEGGELELFCEYCLIKLSNHILHKYL